MTLEKTSTMMTSSDFKERFKAEYYQLKLRADGLGNMLEKYKNGELNFTPKCSYDLLNSQLRAMRLYMEILEERAMVESIGL